MLRIIPVVGAVLWVVVAAALSEGYFSAITVQTIIENRSSPDTKCVTIVSRCEHKHSCRGTWEASALNCRHNVLDVRVAQVEGEFGQLGRRRNSELN